MGQEQTSLPLPDDEWTSFDSTDLPGRDTVLPPKKKPPAPKGKSSPLMTFDFSPKGFKEISEMAKRGELTGSTLDKLFAEIVGANVTHKINGFDIGKSTLNSYLKDDPNIIEAVRKAVFERTSQNLSQSTFGEIDFFEAAKALGVDAADDETVELLTGGDKKTRGKKIPKTVDKNPNGAPTPTSSKPKPSGTERAKKKEAKKKKTKENGTRPVKDILEDVKESIDDPGKTARQTAKDVGKAKGEIGEIVTRKGKTTAKMLGDIKPKFGIALGVAAVAGVVGYAAAESRPETVQQRQVIDANRQRRLMQQYQARQTASSMLQL